MIDVAIEMEAFSHIHRDLPVPFRPQVLMLEDSMILGHLSKKKGSLRPVDHYIKLKCLTFAKKKAIRIMMVEHITLLNHYGRF